MERVAVYIDGGNFNRSILKPLGFPGEGRRFAHDRFADYLARGRELVSKRYYVGVVRNVYKTEKGASMERGQRKFLDALKNEQGFAVKRGKIIYDGGAIREKGVDVKIAVDLVVGAADDLYDTAILVSSDTDLVPALAYVTYREKNVEYVGREDNPTKAYLQFVTKDQPLLTKEILERFVEDKPKKLKL